MNGFETLQIHVRVPKCIISTLNGVFVLPVISDIALLLIDFATRVLMLHVVEDSMLIECKSEFIVVELPLFGMVAHIGEVVEEVVKIKTLYGQVFAMTGVSTVGTDLYFGNPLGGIDVLTIFFPCEVLVGHDERFVYLVPTQFLHAVGIVIFATDEQHDVVVDIIPLLVVCPDAIAGRYLVIWDKILMSVECVDFAFILFLVEQSTEHQLGIAVEGLIYNPELSVRIDLYFSLLTAFACICHFWIENLCCEGDGTTIFLEDNTVEPVLEDI